MKLTDFLGHEYGPGDTVIYAAMSGRCPNMIFGRVVDVYRVFRSPETYSWLRLLDDQTPPAKWYGKDAGQPEDVHVRVKVQPLRGARWEQHHTKTYYTDSRSGKRINPDAPSGKHVLKESHYVFADGSKFDWAAEMKTWEQRHNNVFGRLNHETFNYYFRRAYHVNYGEPGKLRYALTPDEMAKTQLWCVHQTYQPWVEKHEEGPKPVTLEITDNIVKWEGELPDEAD